MTAGWLGGRVTARAEPMFWAMAALVGWSFGGGSPGRFVLCAAAVAASVAFHEAGHAAACLAFGSGADVVLGGLGGWTVPREPARLHGWRRVVLDLAGCAAGAALAAAAFGSLLAIGALGLRPPDAVATTAVALVEVNVLFTAFNLLPISPMDGGRVVQHLLTPRFGLPGTRAAHGLGLAVGGGAALWFLLRGSTYAAFLCGAMAAGEARSLRRSRRMTAADEDEEVQAAFRRAVERWDAGERDAGADAMAAARARAGAGLVHSAATLQLAYYRHAQDRHAEALDLFRASREEDMTPAAKRAYAETARRQGEHALALRLARTNFHDAPGAETAAAAAVCAAGAGDAAEAVRWLRTAVRHGLAPGSARAAEFDGVRATPEFREWAAEQGGAR